MARSKDAETIRTLVRSLTRQFAHELTTGIEDRFESAIGAFYADYDPHMYKRTHSLYYASDHYSRDSRKRSRIKEISKGFEAGICVDDDLIEEVLGETPYRNIFATSVTGEDGVTREFAPGDPFPADVVFRQSFEEGIHGFYKNGPHPHGLKHFPHKMRPTPERMLTVELNRYLSKKSLDNAWKKYEKTLFEGLDNLFSSE